MNLITKSLILLLVLQIHTVNLMGDTYPTDTINKDSYVTNVFGGIEQANKLREFRDSILLQSKEGKAYIESFYGLLSSAAYVMVMDEYASKETTRILSIIAQEVEETLEKKKIPLEMVGHVDYLLDIYTSSSFANKTLINKISLLKKENPIAKFVDSFNAGTLTKNSDMYVKYAKDTLLVKVKSNITQNSLNSILNTYGLTIEKNYPEINLYKIKVPHIHRKNMKTIIHSLETNKDIEYAEPNSLVHINRIPYDPHFGKLWGLHNMGQDGGTYDADIDAPEAWNKFKGSNVIVAVIDTGVNYNHPDLKDNMWVNTKEIPNNKKDDDHNGYVDDYLGWDFVNDDKNPMDDENHGTHCSGTIGASGNNDRGIVGVNWRVRIMPLKFLDSCGSGESADAAEAILYAAKMGAQIASNSWGGDRRSKAIYDAIKYYKSRGGLFIAAAGNDHANNDKTPMYPASYELNNIISVAATDRNDKLAGFSNYGRRSVDIAAPGKDIYSTVIDGYDSYNGTSMATPHVAGVAALIRGNNKRLNYGQIKRIIFNSVDKKSSLKGKVSTGGRLNAAKAINAPKDRFPYLIPILFPVLFN